MLVDEDSNTCDYCRSPLIVNDLKGAIVCTSCGVMKEERFVHQSSEYRCFSDDSSGRSDPRRVGNPVNLAMDCQIDLIDISDGRFYKRQHHAYNLQSNSDKAYLVAVKTIKKFCELLDLPILIKPAEEIYFEVKDRKEIKGKRMDTVIAAIIFLAGKKVRTYIKVQSLENIAGSPHKKILKACNVIYNLIPKIVERSHEYVKQIGARLQLPRDRINELEKICKEIENWDIFESKQPKHRTIAASVVYFYSMLHPEMNLTLAQIKDASGVQTDNTIKKYYQHLIDKKDMLLKRAFRTMDTEDLSTF